MAIEEASNQVLEYLKKQKQVNTFRLARELSIDRNKIINIIRDLEEKGSVQFKSGKVIFLRFPKAERLSFRQSVTGGKTNLEKMRETVRVSSHFDKEAKKPFKVIKAGSKPKKGAEILQKQAITVSVLDNLQAENKTLREKLLEIETDIKSQSGFNNKLRIQTEHIEKIEEAIQELQIKAETPKIIKRTIVKNIIKEVPIKKEKSAKPIRFNIPKFMNQKIIAGKINLAGLNKNIRQIHVPEMLKMH